MRTSPKSHRYCVALILVGAILVGVPRGSAATTVADRHREAVQTAREGQTDRALESLDELVEQAPAVDAIRIDRAVIRGWANRHEEALGILDRLEPSDLPNYALESLGKSARNVGRSDLAVSLYDTLLDRAPDSLEPRVGRALARAELGELEEAQKSLREIARDAPLSISPLNALAFVATKASDWLIVAHAHQRILEIESDNQESELGLAQALRAIGTPILALERVEAHPERFDDHFVSTLRAEVAAKRIRHAALPAPSELAQRERTLNAAAFAEETLGRPWRELDLGNALNRRKLVDFVVALQNASRMTEAADLFDYLEERGVDVPGYATLSAASAMLYIERPAKALALYDAVLASEGNDFEAQIGRYYALLETERLDEGLAHIEQLDERQQPWRRGPEGKFVRRNPNKTRATLAAAVAPAFADNVARAQQRIEKLVALAPANSEFRTARAEIYRWRGWPRLSYRETLRVLKFEPELTSARLTKAHAEMDVAQFEAAETTLEELRQALPDHKHVIALNRRWRVHNARFARSAFTVGESSGGSERGARFLRFQTELQSRPIAYRYRLFAEHRFESSSFPSGDVRVNRLDVGVRRRAGPWGLEAALTGGTDDHDALGMHVSADWQPNDYVSLGMRGAIEPPELPLRAVRDGIGGTLFGMTFAYRASESFRTDASYSLLQFDDENRRDSTQVSVEGTVFKYPKHWIDARGEVYRSTNTRAESPYFNPAADLAVSGQLTHTWRWHRHYGREFLHRLELGAGRYKQKGFESGATWSLALEQEWAFDDFTSATARWQRTRRVFDGAPEHESAFSGEVRLRF